MDWPGAGVGVNHPVNIWWIVGGWVVELGALLVYARRRRRA